MVFIKFCNKRIIMFLITIAAIYENVAIVHKTTAIKYKPLICGDFDKRCYWLGYRKTSYMLIL